MISDDTRLVEIYRARGLPEAHVVRLHLEDLGIPVLIENELLQGVVGELPLGWPTAPRVLVPEDQAEAARAAILDHVQRAAGFVSTLAPDPGFSTKPIDALCLACGNPLDAAGACPACGWTFHKEEGASEEPARELPSLWEVMLRAAGRKHDPE